MEDITREKERNQRRPTNAELAEILSRLAESLKKDPRVNEHPEQLSHYRRMPTDVEKAYEVLNQGAQLVHGTATKYTLIGKVEREEQKKLGADLLGGCELVAAATHILLQKESGCARAVRRAAQKAAMAILLSVIRLAEAFEDPVVLEKGVDNKNPNNLVNQKTGAVWEACDKVLNRLLPQGNRNAIRRELFTWTGEANDTMEEFQEMIDLGPAEPSGNEGGTNVDDDDDDDDYFDDGDDQYPASDLPIAKACLAMLKISRGTIKLTLETLECFGAKHEETEDKAELDMIQKLHRIAQRVGDGVTDFGSLMYPPILPSSEKLEAQAKMQVEAILAAQDLVLDTAGLPPSVTELAGTLRSAANQRYREFSAAIEKGKKQ